MRGFKRKQVDQTKLPIEYKKGRQEIGNWVPDEIRLKDTLDREN